MENLIYEDSPLAEYLEGAGRADVQWEDDSSPDDDEEPEEEAPENGSATGLVGGNTDYAPRGPPKVNQTFKESVFPLQRIKISRQSPVGRLCSTCARAVKAKPSEADNARFIEHFRYILVASQLLDEKTSHAAWRTNPPSAATATPSPVEFHAIPTSGAIATGITALTLIWLVQWSKSGSKTHAVNKSRTAIVLVAIAIVATAFYVYARRQLLQYLRHQAVSSSSDLVTSLQAFDASSSSAIQLIQEVELVGRGYKLSVPLPPITRLEQSSNTRRCIRLRKSLRTAFATTLPVLANACQSLQSSIDEDDLERYLDVYDVNNEDVREAAAGYRGDEFEDLEGLKAIRMHQYRFVTLRRLFLCSLLSLEADGSGADYARWRSAGESMQKLALTITQCADRISKILLEEESFSVTSPTTPNSAISALSSDMAIQAPGRQRLREQFRKLATLSTGIRSLQAKMQILREESQLALSSPAGPSTSTITFLDGRTDNIDTASDDDMQLAELGNSLLVHYDAIGSDLKNLVQAWESGRTGLSLSLERAERRISRTSGISSSGLRSPAISLGGLTAVEEVLGGTPDDALKALEGDSSAPDRGLASPRGRSPRNLRISTSTDEVSDAADSGLGMDEVFEAVAIPKPRALGTPQERAARITEERRRMSVARERRDASNQMIRELESVIHSANSTNDHKSSSPFDRRQSTHFRHATGYDHAKRQSVSSIPLSPAPSSVGSIDRQSGDGCTTPVQNGAIGRRRPYSLYKIGTSAGNRVTSL